MKKLKLRCKIHIYIYIRTTDIKDDKDDIKDDIKMIKIVSWVKKEILYVTELDVKISIIKTRTFNLLCDDLLVIQSPFVSPLNFFRIVLLFTFLLDSFIYPTYFSSRFPLEILLFKDVILSSIVYLLD